MKFTTYLLEKERSPQFLGEAESKEEFARVAKILE
jgi:hypothetical protein